jgi:SP family sugar:H+ symporter-like MFS transporter
MPTRFAVTFSYPYLETDAPGHVNLGGRLGFIYGSSAVLAVVFAYFFIPETSRLILEDIDRNFYPQMENKGADMIAYSVHPKVTTLV